MAEFHKNGSFEPLLWNCAATAARINRKAVSSADIILMGEEYQIKLFSVRYITAKRISVTAPWPQVTL